MSRFSFDSKFAISTKVYFEMDHIPDDQHRRFTTFALLFEDGLRSIETRPYQKTTSSWQRGGGGGESQVLDRVVVTFSYSKSAGSTMSGNNGGMIHSVSSTAVYKAGDSHVGSSSSSASNRRFRVEYEWQEEEAVRLTVGSVVMFMAVFLSSIVFLFQTCGLTNDGDDDYYENSSESTMTVMHDEYHPGSSSPSPYSDHYHKKW